MRRLVLTVIVCYFFAVAAFGQVYHYKVAVIGSSTAAGTGASPIDSSWVNLIQAYLKGQHEIDTIYNEARGGTFTGDGASSKKDTGILWVMPNLNPDLVIVSYASNDAAGDVPLDTTMAHLRFIYNTVVNAGKVAWITTPHPRNFLNAGQDDLQLQARDSTFVQFGNFSLDFWHPLVAADSVSLLPQYDAGDGVHVNNAGHQQLYQVVKNANIMSPLIVPLALALDSLSAVPERQDVLLGWHASAIGPMHFVIERSADGESYTAIGDEEAGIYPTGAHFTYHDPAPLAGRNYYRLQTTADGNTSYSSVVSLDWKGRDWAIGDIYLPQGGSQLTVALQSSKNRNVTLAIFDAGGRQVSSQTGYVAAPGTTVTLPVSGLSQGQYFLRIVSADGEMTTKAFLKF